MEEVKKIRLKQEGGAYTTYGIQDARAREDIATLKERVDELDGNVTVNVNPASGTFYRYGEPCTDNWCEKFVAGGNVAVRVETTDAARKFNLREQPSDGIYIASGQMQGWRIVAPDGYRIKGYRLSAVLRTEGQATITASTGQEIVVTQEHGASLAVTGLNAQEATFMTTDSSTIWGDRQIWILTFEIFAERTDRFALKSEVDGKQDIIDDLANIRSGASAGTTAVQPEGMSEAINEVVQGLENGDIVSQYAKTLEDWADQKAIATSDTYTVAVRTTGGDIPIETSEGSKLESIKPVAGSRWTAKLLFNGSYNMLNAAKWGATNSQPYVGGVGSDFVYFLVPELTLGTFGTADENNGLLFTDSDGDNVQPASVYFKPLGTAVPQNLTDGTSITPTDVSYDGNTYKTYETSGAGWLIIPKTYYDNDVCAHIAWEDWYDKHVSLNEPTTNPEAVVGILMLEGLLALAHSNKYLLGINDEVCDNVEFGDTSATITHMVDELSVAANAWTNSATGESDSKGNALYRHSATVSAIKQGGAACVEGEDGGIPLTVNGTTVSYIDANATAPASTVFYEVTSESTTKAYTDSIFDGSNINAETGILPINDCSIEAQVAIDGEANITVKYAKNIVDQVAINATVDVPQIKKQVGEHEERIVELEDTAVRTGSYDATVAVGLADNLKGDTIVNAEFYKRKTGGTQSVGSGIAAIKEVRGKSIVWNQLFVNPGLSDGGNTPTGFVPRYGSTFDNSSNDYLEIIGSNGCYMPLNLVVGHKYLTKWKARRKEASETSTYFYDMCFSPVTLTDMPTDGSWLEYSVIKTAANSGDNVDRALRFISPTSIQLDKHVGFQAIDLTLMFGAGNEPATVAEFEKMFPLDYYDYNEGEIIPFAGQNLVTTGKNQYNPATGKANLLGGQTYQLLGTYTNATIDGVAVTLDSNNCFTTTKDCVLEITGGNDTDTFVGLYNGETNTYEPYEKHTLPLDPSQWRDKDGNLVFPYGGMHGVGTAYDYAKVDADGYIRKAVRVFERVDLGSLNWRLSDLNTFHATIGDTLGRYSKGICSGYPVIYTGYPPDSAYLQYDKVVILSSYWGPWKGRFGIRDSSYNDATTFKAAMQGVPLYYELATPVEVELATPIYAKYLVDKDGTEEITPANGTTPYTAPANLSILYAMDARGEIKNLPKGYLSKESAENMLNAMVAAGVIQSYTMTYDAANARYQFTFVKAQQESTNASANEQNI